MIVKDHMLKLESSFQLPIESQSEIQILNNETDSIAGKHDQNIKEEGEFSTSISEIYLHPQYNPGQFVCVFACVI